MVIDTLLVARAYLVAIILVTSIGTSQGARPLGDHAFRQLLQNQATQPGEAARIVGGTPVVTDRYPYAAAIFSTDKAFCSGVAIHPSIVLTAGHCSEGGDIFGVKVGMHDWITDDMVGHPYYASTVSHIERPPDYAKNAQRQDKYSDMLGDVSILVLDTPLPADYPVMALPNATTTPTPHLTTIGYGTTQYSNYENTNKQLREVTLDYVDRTTCNNLLNKVAPNSYNLTTAVICAGYLPGGKDACTGDSGGPLFIRGQTYAQDVLVGLTSFGEGCAQKNVPAGYTNILQYAPWIKQRVQALTATM